MITLADLDINERGIIVNITAENEIRRRLLDMGLVKGINFKVLRKAPLGDPIEICLRGFNLSLRIQEAKTIIVERVNENNYQFIGKRRGWGNFMHRFGKKCKFWKGEMHE